MIFTAHISNTEENNYTQILILNYITPLLGQCLPPLRRAPSKNHSLLHHHNLLIKTSASAVFKSPIHPEHSQTPTGLRQYVPSLFSNSPCQVTIAGRARVAPVFAIYNQFKRKPQRTADRYIYNSGNFRKFRVRNRYIYLYN